MRVGIVKLNGFWHLLDTKNDALISVKDKSGKLRPVRAKTEKMIEQKADMWEELFKWQEVRDSKTV
ncbi:hypothetical protein NVP1101O_052 [Vibrio phage 1.101.O._10N.261.45.C6]|nr:hypothetical protein NVP1084O_046 [Vibrio phage 1.084.O._10N.261.49.F5]AUR87463.1 hypothetical protein NVP1101O_052 [Vibrio phage 1.101.O._10N.261.45.C6]